MALTKGTKVKLLEMNGDPDPASPGTLGTVAEDPVTVAGSVVARVDWDGGRRLNLVSPPDKYEEVPVVKAPVTAVVK